jgi:hypothetical protein
MEICQQRPHDPKFISGVNENIGLAYARPQHTVLGLTRQVFQSAHSRGSNCNHAPARRYGSIDLCRCLF